MNKKLKFELRRKFIHIFALVYIFIYLYFSSLYNHQSALFSLLILLVLFFILEFYRIQLKKQIPLINIFWREKEKNTLGGHIYFLIGAIIAFSVFETNIAVTSLLIAIFGDMAAALFGIKFGRHFIKRAKSRTWEGVIAELIVNFIIAILILDNFILAISMSLAATFVETVFEHVNDNLSIPVFAGAIGQILFYVTT